MEDDACGVLFDLTAGSIEDPLEQTNGARRAGAAPSLVRSFAHHHDHLSSLFICLPLAVFLSRCPASWHQRRERLKNGVRWAKKGREAVVRKTGSEAEVRVCWSQVLALLAAFAVLLGWHR